MRRDQLLEQEVIFEQFNNQIPEQPPTAPQQAPGDAITGLISNTLVVGGKVGTQQNVELPQPLDPGANPNFASLSLSGNIVVGGSVTGGSLSVSLNHASNPVINANQLGAGPIQRWQRNGVDIASLSALGKLLLPAGIGSTPSTDQISNFGTYFIDTVVRATPASTAETEFSSKTIAPNVLANDGDFFVLLLGVNYAGNANLKTFKVYFGSTAIFTIGPTNLGGVNTTNQFLVGYLYRRTSTVLTGMLGDVIPNGSNATLIDIGGQNFAASNVFKTTGQNNTGPGVAADIEQFGLILLKGSV
jgi:hypothetical protein